MPDPKIDIQIDYSDLPKAAKGLDGLTDSVEELEVGFDGLKKENIGDEFKTVGREADNASSAILNIAKRIGIVTAIASGLGAIVSAFSISNVLQLSEELAELQTGEKHVDELSDSALNLNKNLSELEISRLIAVNEQFGEQRSKLSEISSEVTNGFAPVLHGLLNNIEDIEDGFLDWLETGDIVTNAIIGGMGFVIDGIDGATEVVKRLEIAYLTMGEKGTGAFKEAGVAGADLANNTLGGIVRSIGGVVGGFSDLIKLTSQAAFAVDGLDSVTGRRLTGLAIRTEVASKKLENYKITVDDVANSHDEFSANLAIARDELIALQNAPSGAEQAALLYKEWSDSLDDVATNGIKLRKALKEQRDAEEELKNSRGANNKLAADRLKRIKDEISSLAALEQGRAKTLSDLNRERLGYEENTLAIFQLDLEQQRYGKNKLALTPAEIAHRVAIKASNIEYKEQLELLEKGNKLIAEAEARSVELSFSVGVQDGNLSESEQQIANDAAAASAQRAKLENEGLQQSHIDLVIAKLEDQQATERLIASETEAANSARQLRETLAQKVINLQDVRDQLALSAEDYQNLKNAQDLATGSTNENIIALEKQIEAIKKAKEAKSELESVQLEYVDALFEGKDAVLDFFKTLLVEAAKAEVALQLFGIGEGASGSRGANFLSGITGGSGSFLDGIGSFFGFHSGGIVGSGEQSFVRSLPKMHTGGIVGSNEQVTILERGEGVFTQAQMQALTPVSNNNASNMSVVVESSAASFVHVEQISPAEVRIMANEEAKKAIATDTPKLIDQQSKNPNSTISKSFTRNNNVQRRRA